MREKLSMMLFVPSIKLMSSAPYFFAGLCYYNGMKDMNDGWSVMSVIWFAMALYFVGESFKTNERVENAIALKKQWDEIDEEDQKDGE